MTDELFRRVATYQATMALMKYVLKDRLINEDEYIRMEEKFSQKYGLKSSVIYRVNPLINLESRAKIT